MRPCVSDAEFIEKLRYLTATECSLRGGPEFLTEFGSVLIAVRGAAPRLAELAVQPPIGAAARFGLVTLAGRSPPPACRS